ncbi:MAG: hypothetical protein HFJ54_02250 [Clostridia bacterium]|nr:hypothetical protein [Clostridia bacterium]
MRSLIVNKKFNNKDLKTFLMDSFPCLTKNTFFKALRKKNIRINNIKVSENVILHTSDNVTLYILDKYLFDKDFSLDIVYEDDNILVINKPKNLEVTRKQLFV